MLRCRYKTMAVESVMGTKGGHPAIRPLAIADAGGHVLTPAKRPLYVRRQVKNVKAVIEWAKGQGFETTLLAEDLDVTVAFSKEPVDWGRAGPAQLSVWALGGPRTVEPLGADGAVVLKFECPELAARWSAFLGAGASWDHDSYHPHITITYQPPSGLDLRRVAPFDGVIELGPEIFEPIKAGWADGITEHAERDYTQVKRDLDTLEARALNALRVVLTEMRDFITAKVRRTKDTSALVRGLDFSARIRGDLRRACAELLRRAWDMGGRDARREVREGRNAVRRHDMGPSFTPVAALRWLNDKSFWITGVVGDKVLGDAKGVLIQGMKTGRSNQQMVDDIAAVFEPYIGKAPGVQSEVANPYRLETIIRTNTTDAYNHGRLTEYKAPGVIDGIVAVRYSAILDERTTEVCKFLDGRLFKPASADVEILSPPNHFNCFISGKTKVYTATGWKQICDIRRGDLALTHRGRFRPVTSVHHLDTPRTYRGDVVEVSIGSAKSKRVVCTPEHPLLTQRGWVAAHDIAPGDKLIALSKPCFGCAKPIQNSAGNDGDVTYCSIACQVKHDYLTGRRVGSAITAHAHEVTRAMAKAGECPLTRPDVRQKAMERRLASPNFRHAITAGRRGANNPMSKYPEKARASGERLMRRWKENPDLHPNRSMANVSKPQRRLFAIASVVFPDAMLEYPLQTAGRMRFLDVAIPSEKIGIEYDGAHWHQDAERDARRLAEINNAGWQVLVYRDFVPEAEQLRADIRRVLANHAGEYKFMERVVMAVRRRALNRTAKLYNLSVEEDESYVIGSCGAVVHNCRSILVPVVAGESFNESDFVTPEVIGKAKALTGAGFLAERVAWRNYSEGED